MQPVATVAEMRAADAAALSSVDHATLVARAGFAVARVAAEMLDPPYGRRVVIVAGKGSNGADGRIAGYHLSRRGALVHYIPAEMSPAELPACDLLIDAAYGTGLRDHYIAPKAPEGAPVLAVDIPSGVDGDTGTALGRPWRATRTVTFAAWKTGLVQGDGALLAGRVSVADIGVDVFRTGVALVGDHDVRNRVPARPAAAQKWDSAVAVIAGSPGMEGAAALAAEAALRAGAGMVRLFAPAGSEGHFPKEAVRCAMPEASWAEAVLSEIARCKAVVIGPGLGRSDATIATVRALIAKSSIPMVIDADALFALGDADGAREVIRSGRPIVLTPHDGEYRRLAGGEASPDRIAAARILAAKTGAVVLLKGPTTVVASPAHGDIPDVLIARSGSARLATAGTGDVLSGVIGAFLARGVPTHLAAALGAHLHGRAAERGSSGMLAGDLPRRIAHWWTPPRKPNGRRPHG